MIGVVKVDSSHIVSTSRQTTSVLKSPSSDTSSEISRLIMVGRNYGHACLAEASRQPEIASPNHIARDGLRFYGSCAFDYNRLRRDAKGLLRRSTPGPGREVSGRLGKVVLARRCSDWIQTLRLTSLALQRRVVLSPGLT